MKIISHRGNLSGPNPAEENNPAYILAALSEGFDVEVDAWFIDEHFYLGHDEPKFQVDSQFLAKRELWCHAKNYSALFELMKIDAQCFWHQEDDLTITSSGFIWTHSKNPYSCNKSVHCWIDGKGVMPSGGYGVCTDYVYLAKNALNAKNRDGNFLE